MSSCPLLPKPSRVAVSRCSGGTRRSCCCHPQRQQQPMRSRAAAAPSTVEAAATATAQSDAPAVFSTPSTPVAPTSASPSANEVIVYFRQEGTSTVARPGEDFLEVASRCRADIPTGCLHGSCGVCEVELFKFTRRQQQGEGQGQESGEWVEAGSPAVLRACVAKVPRGWGRVEVGMMSVDQIWGQDGWDT